MGRETNLLQCHNQQRGRHNADESLGEVGDWWKQYQEPRDQNWPGKNEAKQDSTPRAQIRGRGKLAHPLIVDKYWVTFIVTRYR